MTSNSFFVRQYFFVLDYKKAPIQPILPMSFVKENIKWRPPVFKHFNDKKKHCWDNLVRRVVHRDCSHNA